MPISGVNLTPRPTAFYASDPALPRRPQDSLPSCLLGFERTRLALASSYQLPIAPRIRLPPRVSDGKALLRPRVKDARFGEPVVGDLGDPLPRRAVLLAASPQRASPEVDDVVVECLQGTAGHGMVVVVAGDDLPQPPSLVGNGLVHPPSQFLLDLRELRLQRRVFRWIWKSPRRVLPQMNVKPRKVKVSGLPSPRRFRLAAAKRPNSSRRVLSGCSDNANSCNRSRMASQKRRASCSKPISSA